MKKINPPDIFRNAPQDIKDAFARVKRNGRAPQIGKRKYKGKNEQNRAFNIMFSDIIKYIPESEGNFKTAVQMLVPYDEPDLMLYITEQSVKHHPDSPIVLAHLGQLYMNKGQSKKALAPLEASLRYSSCVEGKVFSYQLLVFCYQDLDMQDKILEAHKSLLALGADNPLSYNNIGHAFANAGQNLDAIIMFTIGEEMFPDNPMCYSSHAELYFEAGDNEMGNYYANKAYAILDNNPNDDVKTSMDNIVAHYEI